MAVTLHKGSDMAIESFIMKPAESYKTPDKVVETITAKSLNELDLDKELLAQYKNARTMLEEVKSDDEVALNQKAQLMNTITSILSHIINLQEKLHNIETMKRIELTLINVLQNHQTLKDAFLTEYETALLTEKVNAK